MNKWLQLLSIPTALTALASFPFIDSWVDRNTNYTLRALPLHIFEESTGVRIPREVSLDLWGSPNTDVMFGSNFIDNEAQDVGIHFVLDLYHDNGDPSHIANVIVSPTGLDNLRVISFDNGDTNDFACSEVGKCVNTESYGLSNGDWITVVDYIGEIPNGRSQTFFREDSYGRPLEFNVVDAEGRDVERELYPRQGTERDCLVTKLEGDVYRQYTCQTSHDFVDDGTCAPLGDYDGTFSL
jgi:hypothetical protein